MNREAKQTHHGRCRAQDHRRAEVPRPTGTSAHNVL